MLDFEILGARYDEDNNRIEIVKEITNDDGTTHMHLHMFSVDILEWRAAEYGIDDVDTLIDIVVYEPFTSGTDVYHVTAKTAREVHLQKINEAKTKQRVTKLSKVAAKTKLSDLGITEKYLDAVDNDPISVIKGNCSFDAKVIKMNKEYVAKERATLGNKEVATQKIGKLKASEIRKKLFRESETLTESKNSVKEAATDNKSNHVQIVMRDGKIVKE